MVIWKVKTPKNVTATSFYDSKKGDYDNTQMGCYSHIYKGDVKPSPKTCNIKSCYFGGGGGGG